MFCMDRFENDLKIDQLESLDNAEFDEAAITQTHIETRDLLSSEDLLNNLVSLHLFRHLFGDESESDHLVLEPVPCVCELRLSLDQAVSLSTVPDDDHTEFEPGRASFAHTLHPVGRDPVRLRSD